MLVSCALAAGTYMITRTGSYLSTRPEDIGEFLGDLRNSFANVVEQTKKCLGERRWEFASHVIWDNLWISVFAVSLLLFSLEAVPIGIALIGNSIVLGLGICTISWMIRLGLNRCLSFSPATSEIGSWIAPKM